MSFIILIAAATIKMIAISSAHSVFVLSVKPKQTKSSCTYPTSCELRPYIISLPLQAHPPKPH